MIENVLNVLLKSNCKDVIITDDLMQNLEKDVVDYIKENFNVTNMDDIRSATFFSLGNANIINKSICIIIDGEYLPNIYTGITEAWFQKKNIIVIALYKDFDRINCEYLRKCVPNIINIYNNDISFYRSKIEMVAKSCCPALINVKNENLKNNSKDYSNLCNILNKFLKNTDEIFLYNANIESKYNFKIKNIQKEHKYGILSKYMAYTIAKQKKIILCCTAEVLKLDLNIFNNRYVNENIKIIVIDDENFTTQKHMEEWIKSNEINVSIEDKMEERRIIDFYNSNRAEVMIVGGEK